ncbi:hypothetical protein [Spectribacter hydrogenoxidans]|uniref:Transposase n=1 Tax=Spectribacter hydrogenoxidans TaxID=3075608 RepID=A0ABU3C0I6_9GAMM|nr:hypothetical protein [Salinisphaera sp. W335]MDT0635069.1 hypothetical protein [Salinisphaera sp. W335]
MTLVSRTPDIASDYLPDTEAQRRLEQHLRNGHNLRRWRERLAEQARENERQRRARLQRMRKRFVAKRRAAVRMRTVMS